MRGQHERYGCPGNESLFTVLLDVGRIFPGPTGVTAVTCGHLTTEIEPDYQEHISAETDVLERRFLLAEHVIVVLEVGAHRCSAAHNGAGC